MYIFLSRMKKIIIGVIALTIIGLGYLAYRLTVARSTGVTPLSPEVRERVDNAIRGAKPIDTFGTYKITQPSGTTAPSTVPRYDIYISQEQRTVTIVLYEYPLAEARRVAEQDLLKKLNISQEQACQLAVNIGVLASTDPELAGVNFGLSFCPGSLDFPEQ